MVKKPKQIAKVGYKDAFLRDLSGIKLGGFLTKGTAIEKVELKSSASYDDGTEKHEFIITVRPA